MFWRTVQRIWRIKVVLTALMMSVLIVGSGHILAQSREAARREQDRIERRVDGLQKDVEELSKRYETLNLDTQKRLIILEAYMRTMVSASWWLITGVAGLLGIKLFDLIFQRRSVKSP